MEENLFAWSGWNTVSVFKSPIYCDSLLIELDAITGCYRAVWNNLSPTAWESLCYEMDKLFYLEIYSILRFEFDFIYPIIVIS